MTNIVSTKCQYLREGISDIPELETPPYANDWFMVEVIIIVLLSWLLLSGNVHDRHAINWIELRLYILQ